MKTPLQILDGFKARFGTTASAYRAPGRLNLIGEHTDYNEGFVLPAAIDFYCWAAAAPRGDGKLVIHSENFNETIEARLDSLSPLPEKHWANYPLGVAWALRRAGKPISGANVYIAGEVPLGAGLSSSAAVEVSVAFALLRQSGDAENRAELAKLCQKAENEFVGARVGIMDQFISCFGRASHALLLDCRSLKHEFVRLPPNLQLVICNTMVRHELASGEYNTRRAECEEGVRILRIVLPEVRALRDVTLSQLEDHRQNLSRKVFARCRHVITENARVNSAVEAFRKGDTTTLGPLLQDSHRSLRDDYEVSCRELDLMVEVAAAQPGLIGARMTGGGFGGCTINLVESAAVSDFRRNVAAAYSSETGLTPEIYVSPAAEGAKEITLEENRPVK
ncbi:MAG: galactokinase [Acidobacteria bacterium 13_2_20CM_57_17]|nr:MAG: galactokinase [Acidobacteria bacterium 13_2_20CM_57_17]